MIGRRRADAVATRLGTALRDGRVGAGERQADAGDRVGISQQRWSELERGLGNGASLETWAIAATAVGSQLAAFLEHLPGADRPRDIEHLRRQNALVEFAAAGGWRGHPELAVDPITPRSRSIDVALLRTARREAIAAEIWDWFADVGEAYRGLDAKRALLARRLTREGDEQWRVRGLLIVRGTKRNRQLVRELAALFAGRFPARAADWLACLRDPANAMPADDGLLWSDRDGRVHASRLRSAS